MACVPTVRGLLFAVLSLSVAACQGPRGASNPEAAVQASASPPARAIRVDPDVVVIEGRWYPIDAAGVSADVSFVVRATCVRTERRCREELTTVGAGHAPTTETIEYRVREWTTRKLVAARPEGSEEVQLRVSLTGLAAEKVTASPKDRHKPETRWRLE